MRVTVIASGLGRRQRRCGMKISLVQINTVKFLNRPVRLDCLEHQWAGLTSDRPSQPLTQQCPREQGLGQLCQPDPQSISPGNALSHCRFTIALLHSAAFCFPLQRRHADHPSDTLWDKGLFLQLFCYIIISQLPFRPFTHPDRCTYSLWELTYLSQWIGSFLTYRSHICSYTHTS